MSFVCNIWVLLGNDVIYLTDAVDVVLGISLDYNKGEPAVVNIAQISDFSNFMNWNSCIMFIYQHIKRKQC